MNDHPVIQVRMIRRLLCAKTYKRLHYWVGVSQDNAIQIMNFFTGLDLSKSQADSLLSQLADDWEQQRDTIAELIALRKKQKKKAKGTGNVCVPFYEFVGDA